MLGNVPSNSARNPQIALFRSALSSFLDSNVVLAPAKAFVWPALLFLSLCIIPLTGCSHFRPRPTAQYIYVTAKQTFLRDRVAAVSNRTGIVENGQRLEVLEHGRRYFRVKTEKGEVGWISEKSIATQDVFDAFEGLRKEHQDDPVVASAKVDDEANLHLKPGRESQIFYLLPENDKVELLKRATLPKPATGMATPVVTTKATEVKAADATAEPAIPMEDWWLIRDGKGRTGWLLSRRIDVDVPDSISRYSEGQRIVGAYILSTVYDPDASDQPDKNVPIYVTVLAPLHAAGLPYDFDQVRVFTWNLKMHRYETALREKNIEGYLPVKIAKSTDPYGKSATAQASLPSFTYRVLAADAGPVTPDPVTGMITPGRTIEKTYRLEGNIVRRVQAPSAADDPEAHPAPEEKQDKKARRHR
jgi:uncharacterized protein YgiM (DUF1202 family)